jgi:hypothetical protein
MISDRHQLENNLLTLLYKKKMLSFDVKATGR